MKTNRLVIVATAMVFLGLPLEAQILEQSAAYQAGYRGNGGANGGTDNNLAYFTGYKSNDGVNTQFNSFLVFNLPSNADQIVTAATLTLYDPDADITNSAGGTLSVYTFTGNASTATYSNLVAGDFIGSVAISETYSAYLTISLNAQGIADIEHTTGSSFAIGLSYTEANPVTSDAIFYNSSYGNAVSQNSFVITSAPEPSCSVLLLCGVGLLIVWRSGWRRLIARS